MTAATPFLRRSAAALVAFAGVVLLAVSPAAARQQRGLLDPCSAVTPGAVNATFGATAETPEYGTAGSKTVHGVKVKTCSWTYASAQLVVSVAPKTLKPAGWPAGTTLRTASGFGANAKLATNTRQGTSFVAVTFTKGGSFGEVWVTGGRGAPSVLRLGRQLYAKL
jgi:hypothetical protein